MFVVGKIAPVRRHGKCRSPLRRRQNGDIPATIHRRPASVPGIRTAMRARGCRERPTPPPVPTAERQRGPGLDRARTVTHGTGHVIAAAGAAARQDGLLALTARAGLFAGSGFHHTGTKAVGTDDAQLVVPAGAAGYATDTVALGTGAHKGLLGRSACLPADDASGQDRPPDAGCRAVTHNTRPSLARRQPLPPEYPVPRCVRTTPPLSPYAHILVDRPSFCVQYKQKINSRKFIIYTGGRS